MPELSELSRKSSEPSMSQSIDLTLDDTATEESSQSLPWEPQILRPKGSTFRYWIVENTKQCSEFCKSQLKVYIF